MNRVVITGMGIISPIGIHRDEVWENLVQQKTGIVSMPEWDNITDLKVSLAGVCKEYAPKRINRRNRRTMGAMAVMAAISAMDAMEQAQISPATMQSGRAGVAMGSTTGSGQIIQTLFDDFLNTGGISKLEGTAFMKIMNHSVAANLASMLGVMGRVISPCSACATSTQAIGLGYEAIKDGYQDIMLCGGADELHPTTAGVFDVLNAASRQKTAHSPMPFDENRDGLVVGEGAGTLILESLAHAQKRHVKILGEVIGYHTTCDGAHMTSPQDRGMVSAMTGALASAGMTIRDIDYINAHATGTRLGDAAESRAIAMLGKHHTPVSATKGYTGHTLAASGVMEAIFCLLMMEKNIIIPTRNLNRIGSDCNSIAHVTRLINSRIDTVMTSNFAFGGINAALILKKHRY
ncbi:MAG: beta-ketoacyl-[acyl-carrier-protein] synthase family protein [Desulfobacteraceae bacterium]|nr:beta-ketoacyl-[acyl-carrier-protein] synthase family protein [Desulfobacteraceae bacterium]